MTRIKFDYDLNTCSKKYTGSTKDEAVLKEAAKEWGVDAKVRDV